jgi:hypothetical protein
MPVHSANRGYSEEQAQTRSRRYVEAIIPKGTEDSKLPSADWKCKRVVLDEEGVTRRVQRSEEFTLASCMTQKKRVDIERHVPGHPEYSIDFYKQEGLVIGSSLKPRSKTKFIESTNLSESSSIQRLKAKGTYKPNSGYGVISETVGRSTTQQHLPKVEKWRPLTSLEAEAALQQKILDDSAKGSTTLGRYRPLNDEEADRAYRLKLLRDKRNLTNEIESCNAKLVFELTNETELQGQLRPSWECITQSFTYHKQKK